MKLLFDQNLSFRLCSALIDTFPESSQVSLLGLERADDDDVWRYARDNNYLLVSQDADFAELAALRGAPPKVIWLRCGNQPTSRIVEIMRSHMTVISSFAFDEALVCLEIVKRTVQHPSP